MVPGSHNEESPAQPCGSSAVSRVIPPSLAGAAGACTFHCRSDFESSRALRRAARYIAHITLLRSALLLLPRYRSEDLSGRSLYCASVPPRSFGKNRLTQSAHLGPRVRVPPCDLGCLETARWPGTN